MNKRLNYILMADIIGSRKTNQQKLMKDFKNIAGKVDQALRDQFLSPITITLGDEFQSIPRDLSSALTVILQLEEAIIKAEKGFKLRYVLVEGLIETPINSKIAYEMLGSGLTKARELLTQSKKTKSRFKIVLQDEALGCALTNSFVALQSIIDDWKLEKDYYIVEEFLQHADYKKVALVLDKERSLMWKRERSLKLEEYFALKEVINYLGGG